MTESLLAYKNFAADWTCRGFKYEIGKTYLHDGDVKLCESGFHACEYPLDIFAYYDPTGQVAQVELGDVSEKTDDKDSKRCAKSITIKASLTIPLLVAAAIEYTVERCDPVKARHATGDRSASSATGDRSASSATGYGSASSATGYGSASSATGYGSASSATGDSSASSATGYSSASSATGQFAVAAAFGLDSKAMAGKDGTIIVAWRDKKTDRIRYTIGYVGENGIEADTWYQTNAAGELKEIK